MAEISRRIFIIFIGILDLVRQAILGTWRIGLMFLIVNLMVACTHHFADELTFDLVGVALITCVQWLVMAPVFLVVFLFDRYRYGRRALRVYHRCRTVSQIILLNQAFWKRIWQKEEFLTYWEK